MKKSCLIIAGYLVLMLSSSFHARAQLSPVDSINNQLRQIFTPLFRPLPQKEFLYDMAAHFTDHPFNNHNSTDVISSDTWYRIYEECFYMAYDTTWLPKSDDIYSDAANIPGDTIPIGIFDFDYYRLKPNALTTNLYFDFDTINGILTDIAGRPDEPYTTGNVFVAAPLFHMTQTTKVVFTLGNIIYDAANTIYYGGPPYDLYIDFGDGNGKQYFNPSLPTTYTANYAAGQTVANIITTIEVDGVEIKLSKSELILGASESFTAPDLTYVSNELNVYVFNSTGACVNPGERKVVLYLTGFNMFDFIPKYKRDPGGVYDEMIKRPQIANLKNFGYEFHIVVWNSSRRDIRANAMDVVMLLDNLKQAYGTDHQFIIIGESMGGLVARYAMCFMESATYQDPLAWPSGYDRGFMHNTRELITIDSPHQGANIPLSLQTFYDDALEFFGFMSPMSARYIMRVFNLFIDGDAARQMLIYHIDTKSGGGLYKNYSEDPMKTQFFNELRSISVTGNGYPVHCKLIALSNGSLSGIPQMRFYNTTPRAANDQLLNANIEIFARILWFKVRIISGNLAMLTNPNGAGLLYNQTVGFFRYRLKFKWFGVKLVTTFIPITNRSEYADVMPLCTSPGGYYTKGLEQVIGNSTSNQSWALSRFELFNLFEYKTGSNGNGCWNFSAHVGINGLASANTNLQVCSDGFHFCFIPIQSALDYGTLGVSPTLFYDIESDPLAVKLASTPFDVFSGIALADPAPIMPNMTHLYVKYGNNENGLMSSNFKYQQCGGAIYGHWLNREIGDDHLYLDNFDAAWSSTYESYDWLTVSGINPVYNSATLPGIYSRNDPFTHDPNFAPLFSTFLCDATNYFPSWPYTHYDIGGSLPPAEYSVSQTPGINCCMQYRIAAPTEASGPETMAIYPNPLDGTQALSIDLVAVSEAQVQLSIVDCYGRLIHATTLADKTIAGKQTFTVSLDELQLAPGIYIVRVNTGTNEFQRKLIVE
jgi:hypothetical protein